MIQSVLFCFLNKRFYYEMRLHTFTIKCHMCILNVVVPSTILRHTQLCTYQFIAVQSIKIYKLRTGKLFYYSSEFQQITTTDGNIFNSKRHFRFGEGGVQARMNYFPVVFTMCRVQCLFIITIRLYSHQILVLTFILIEVTASKRNLPLISIEIQLLRNPQENWLAVYRLVL